VVFLSQIGQLRDMIQAKINNSEDHMNLSESPDNTQVQPPIKKKQMTIDDAFITKMEPPTRDISTEAVIKGKLRAQSTMADGNCCYRALTKAHRPRGSKQPGKEAGWPMIERDIIRHHRQCPHRRTSTKVTTEEAVGMI
jgi:hypothetical protein